MNDAQPSKSVVHPGQQERPPVGRVGTMIRMCRVSKKQSLRETARDIGIDYSTMSRLERCEIVPNVRNFLKLVEWLELSPEGAMAVARSLVREVDGRPLATPSAGVVATRLRNIGREIGALHD
jgi:transcriptional regulator with XRE-family HTH domain